MMMPIRDVERHYLAQLPTMQEKHDALNILLQSNHPSTSHACH